MKKFLTIFSFFIVLGILFCYFGGATFAANEKNKMFLSEYDEYGIIAKIICQTSDMETNFICDEYTNIGGQTCGNSHYTNAPGKIKINNITNGIQARRGTVVIEDESVKNEVKTILSSIDTYSKSVVKNNDTDIPEVVDINNYTIDITNIDKETVYVNVDSFFFSNVQNGGLKIKLNDDQVIVLNCTKTSVTIPRYRVETGKEKEDIARSVIWNMPYVGDLALESDGMFATIIAPNAMCNLNVTSSGWLVIDTLVSNNGEWHCVSQSIPEYTSTPKATNTPKLTETPKITEKPKPTETPNVTESLKPTDTPKVTETVIPTETPVTMVTPKPVTTLTPTSTVVPTLDVTNTPIPTLPPTNPPYIPISTPSEEPTATPAISGEITPTPEATSSEEPTATETPLIKFTSIQTETPLVVLDEEKVPLAKATITPKEKSSVATIIDEDVPLANSTPETGDDINIVVLFIVMILSLTILFVLLWNNK